MAEASEFIFGRQIRFAKAHHKITPKGKKWAWHFARGAPQNCGVPFNISATGEASNFKFGMQLGFPKAHHKITPRGKSGVALG